MVGLGVWSLLLAGVGCVAQHPLAIIADSPYSLAKTSVTVPLLMVDRGTLNMIRHAEIRAVSPTEPLVTCRAGDRIVTDATPAVQVVLREPVYLYPHQESIRFPSEMSVVYGGLRMGLPVGSVVAPVAHQGLKRPQLVRVLYAIPAGPLPLQYPYYDSPPPTFTYSAPAYHQSQVLPIAPITPSIREPPALSYYPSYYPLSSYPTSYYPSSYYTPVSAPESLAASIPAQPEVSNAVADVKRPKPPTVTVLNFPTAVATPEVLYYQPPLEDTELGNRAPPEPVVPAGIVQSTQPVASLETFLNSKESPILNTLREQAEQTKEKNADGSEGVEAL